MKRIKKYQCKECGKKYCFMNGAIRHSKKKGHYKFIEINKEYPVGYVIGI